uniref:rhomboid protease n=1 Tax=Cuerna arida TaxID=1464854 RepID=A0A1B6ETA6_9HEMI
MSICLLRTSLHVGDSYLNICSRWKHHTRKLQRPGLQLPYYLRSTLKTSNWNHSRWPGKRQMVNSIENHFEDKYALSRLWKPLAFTITVSGTSMAGAAIWQYENVRSQAIQAKRWWGGYHTPKYGQFRQHMYNWWHSLSAGDKTFVPICAINVLVFLAWAVRPWQPFMTKYFTAGLASGALCWPMLLSVFSHYSILHLGANMFVLHSFSDRAVSALGREQFVGLYLSAGMVSSFTSYLFKAIIKSPSSSLGASGAVMCILGYFCCRYPESKLAIIFVPNFNFEASSGLKALLCMDTVGCLLRWSFFDHAAHLGGSLCGIAWYYWGQEYIWRKREPLISFWHKLRGPVQ